MKYILCLIFTLGTLGLFSQEKIQTTTINEREYFIYPYKYSISSYSYDGKYIGYNNNSENEIVPYPGDLPNGNYVIYYPSQSRYKKKMWFFHRRGDYYFDTTIVAALFTIKENKLEGFVQYWSMYNVLTEEGNYVNDQRNGIWKKYKNEYLYDVNTKSSNSKSNKYVSKYVDIVEEINYEEGIKQGSYKKYTKDDPSIILVTGFYLDNEESGDWKLYFSNKQLKSSFTYTDSINYDLYSPIKVNIYEDNQYEYENNYREDFSRQINLKGKFHGWFYNYYPNGQLAKRSYYQFGFSKGLDTSYFFNGKIQSYYEVKKEKKDSIINEIIDFYRLDTLGGIELHRQIINEQNTFSKRYYNGKIIDESYYSYFYSNLKNRDTLVISHIEYDIFDESNTSIGKMKRISYLHLETGAIFKKESEPQINNYSYDDFNFTQDKGSKIYYLEEINYKGKNNEFELRTYKHYFRSPYYKYLNYYSTIIDSVKIMVNGKPFSGKFVEHRGYYRKRRNEKVKINNNRIKYYTRAYGGYNYGGTPSFGYSSRFVAYRPRYRFPRGLVKRKTTNTNYATYVNGLLEGNSKTLKYKNGKILENFNYANGDFSGAQKEYSIQVANRWSECKEIVNSEISKKAGLFRRQRYYLMSNENYINGLAEGTLYTYHCNGRIDEKVEYKNGERNGILESFDEEGNIRKRTNFTDDFYNGKYNEWTFSNKLRYDLTFEEGTLVGDYKYYFINGNLETFGTLSDGYKVGEWITYFENGEIKYKEFYELEDSSYTRFGNSNYSTAFTKYPERPEHLKNTCYSQQFYPSGVLAVEGKIERGNRVGIWKFYDEGNNLIKQINYQPGFILQEKANGIMDSISHYGFYESWYRDGKKQSEAYVLSESSKFDCYQQVNISQQDLYYLNFWDQSAKQILTNKTGRIETYHLTTAKPESEGEMINGLRQGYWRYWDPEGKLTKVGNYKNGKENGVWLIGDLEGMHYLDDACFDISSKKVIEEMEYKKKRLSIHVIHYKKGKIIKQNSFDVNLNKNNKYPYNKY